MDANAYANHKKNCKMCNRKGLLILPTRYAIAPKDSKAPALDDEIFKATPNGFSHISLNSETIYTQRLMRKGYLYIYDKTRKGFRKNKETGDFDEVNDPWQGYLVNEKGFLTPYTPWTERPIPSDDDVPCDPWENEMLARCITIERPNEPRPIWIGFSDTIWTLAIFEKAEREIRDKGKYGIMRKLNLETLWGGGEHLHACSIEHCEKHVTEIFFSSKSDLAVSPELCNLTNTFEFSHEPLAVPRMACNLEEMAKVCGIKKLNYPLENEMNNEIIKKYSLLVRKGEHTEMPHMDVPDEFKSGAKDSLIRAAKRILKDDWKKAAIVALDDPVGILKDLSVYWNYAQDKHHRKLFSSKDDRKVIIAGVLECLRDGVKKQAKTKLEREMETYVYRDVFESNRKVRGDLVDYPIIIKVGKHTPPDWPYTERNASERAQAKRIRNNPSDLEAHQINAWKKYENKLIDKDGIEKAKNIYIDATKKYDQEYILPLTKAFVAWLNSPMYIEAMDSNHDSKDICSGLSYSNIVSLCMGTSQDKALIVQEMERQLNSDVIDKSAVLSRSLFQNQDDIGEEVKMALSESKSLTISSIVAESAHDNEPVNQWKFWAKVLGRVEKAVKETLKGTPGEIADLHKKIGNIGTIADLWEATKTVTARLTAQFSAAVVNLSQKAATELLLPAWSVKLGCAGHIPVIRLELEDDIQRAVNYASEHYVNAVPKNLKMNKREIYNFFQEKMEEAKAEALKNKMKAVVYVIPNETAIQQRTQLATDSGSGHMSYKAITENTRIVPEGRLKNKINYYNLHMIQSHYGEGRWVEFYNPDNIARTEAQVANAENRIAKAVEAKVSPTAGILTGALQLGVLMGSISKTIDAVGTGQGDKSREACAVLFATLLSSIENFGKGMEGLAAYYPGLTERRFMGVYWFDKNKPFLRYWAKGFGVAGGAVMGVIDSIHAYKTYEKGQIGMAILYGLSAVANFGGAAVLYATTFCTLATRAMLSAIFFGIGFVIIGLAAMVAIAIWKDDELQEWIGRCILGKDKDTFETLSKEMNELKKLQAA